MGSERTLFDVGVLPEEVVYYTPVGRKVKHVSVTGRATLSIVTRFYWANDHVSLVFVAE